jgi:hypothetical protein
METLWFLTNVSVGYLKKTNIPPECFNYRGIDIIGYRFSIPYAVGAKDWLGVAHYRERVSPEHGSGMYFNAFRNLAFSSERAIRNGDYYGGHTGYSCTRGSFYFATQNYLSFVALDGIHAFQSGVQIEWHGDSVKVVTSGEPTNISYSCADAFEPPDLGQWLNKDTGSLVLRGNPTMAPDEVASWVFSQWSANGGLSSDWRDGGRFYIEGHVPVPVPESLEGPKYFDWKDKEYWAFQWIKEVGVVLPPYGSMVSQAYTEAIASFPSVQSNVLANILEIIELARSILSGDMGKTLTQTRNTKAMKDAWLAYRYSYTTSRLDLEELKAFVDRVGKLPVGEITLRSKISFHHTTVRCSVVLPMSDITGKLEGIESLGLKLSAANVWDLIPYSFVVDWFMRISDWLNYFETQGFSLTLHPRQVWYSITTVYDGQTTYFRWSGSPALGLPFDLYAPVSKKTVAMRIGDVIALS